MELSILRLENDFVGRHVYSKALAKSYLALLFRSLPHISEQIDPSHHFHTHLSIIQTLKSPTFTKVNAHLTAIIGGAPPEFPHSTVEDFYRWASCATDIRGVRVPLLAINADDDPIVQVLPEEEVRTGSSEEGGTGNVMMIVTRGGGHVGWFHGKDGKQRWIMKPITQWFRALNEEVIFPSPESGAADITKRETILCEDGFIRAKGEREEIGFKVFREHESLPSGSPPSSPSDTPSASNNVSVPGAFAGL